MARYTSISNNHKNIELTFARAELTREILKVRASVNSKSLEDQQVNFFFHLKIIFVTLIHFLLLGISRAPARDWQRWKPTR